MIEHCISTLNFHKKKEYEEKNFRIYVSDALMMIAENTTHYFTSKGIEDYGKAFKQRWIEIMEQAKNKKKPPEEDNRSSEEIAKDMWTRIRGH